MRELANVLALIGMPAQHVSARDKNIEGQETARSQVAANGGECPRKILRCVQVQERVGGDDDAVEKRIELQVPHIEFDEMHVEPPG